MTPKFFLPPEISTQGEKLNKYGFRGPVADSEKKILFAGCSFTYGTGVENNETFAHLVTEKLGDSWSYLNLGVPASGIDLQIPTITWALNNFKIDKICWLISEPIRTMFFVNNDQYIKLVPISSLDTMFVTNSMKTDIKKFMEYHFYFENHNLHRLKLNIYTLFSLIKQKEIDFYVSCWEHNFDEELNDLRNEFNFQKLGKFEYLDMGSDNLHPGPKSHLKFADDIIERMKNDK